MCDERRRVAREAAAAQSICMVFKRSPHLPLAVLLFRPFKHVLPVIARRSRPLLTLGPSLLLSFAVVRHHLVRSAVAVGGLCDAVGDGLRLTLMRRRRLAPVRVVVEVSEEDDEGDGVADQGPLHPVGERAARVEGVAGVADGHVELDLMDTEAERNDLTDDFSLVFSIARDLKCVSWQNGREVNSFQG